MKFLLEAARTAVVLVGAYCVRMTEGSLHPKPGHHAVTATARWVTGAETAVLFVVAAVVITYALHRLKARRSQGPQRPVPTRAAYGYAQFGRPAAGSRRDGRR